MQRYNQAQRVMLLAKWQAILDTAVASSTTATVESTRGERTSGERTRGERTRGERTRGERTGADLLHQRPMLPVLFDEAMNNLWGLDPLPVDRPTQLRDPRCRQLDDRTAGVDLSGIPPLADGRAYVGRGGRVEGCVQRGGGHGRHLPDSQPCFWS